MKHTTLTLLTCLLTISAARAAESTPAPASKPRIEVCFVLDTTGSMSGLIEGAKQKIWSIANEMVSTKPTPELKLGLIGYRDKGDDYVTRSFPLTDDIDALYGHLKDFNANGGGDTPESVNEALDEAINKMAWSKDRSVLKIIFLVGDAPPHMDYAQGPKYPDLCRAAAAKDLIINTVQCGSMSETAPIWKEIARLSEGRYAAIAQSGNMAAVTTPMDEKLAELNRRIGGTLIPYGDKDLRSEVREKQAAAEAAPAEVAAARLSYNSRTSKAVQGEGELLDALAKSEVKLEAVETKNLPAELQVLSREELARRVAKAQADRAKIQKEIVSLTKERDSYLQAEKNRTAAGKKGDSFDAKVTDTIHDQAAQKGIKYAR